MTHYQNSKIFGDAWMTELYAPAPHRCLESWTAWSRVGNSISSMLDGYWGDLREPTLSHSLPPPPIMPGLSPQTSWEAQKEYCYHIHTVLFFFFSISNTSLTQILALQIQDDLFKAWFLLYEWFLRHIQWNPKVPLETPQGFPGMQKEIYQNGEGIRANTHTMSKRED